LRWLLYADRGLIGSDGRGFNGGGISYAASNHSILYQLSMLYESIVASVLFSAGFDYF
jgi:hypothetical protein